MPRRFQHNRSDAGSLLAAVFIIALGAGCCLFLVAAMSPANLAKTAWGLGAFCTVFLILIVLQRFGKSAGGLSFLFSASRNRRDDGLQDYEPRMAGEKRSSMVGTNRPISAKEAHDIQITSANTWVPANSGRSRKKEE